MLGVYEKVFASKVGLATLTQVDSKRQNVKTEFKPPNSEKTKLPIRMPKLESGYLTLALCDHVPHSSKPNGH